MNYERIQPGAARRRKVMYGIYDTKENLWIGNDDGPLSYEDHALARVAAQVAEEALLGTDLAMRFRAREIPESAWRLRDDLKLKHSPLKAIQRIEVSVEKAPERKN